MKRHQRNTSMVMVTDETPRVRPPTREGFHIPARVRESIMKQAREDVKNAPPLEPWQVDRLSVLLTPGLTGHPKSPAGEARPPARQTPQTAEPRPPAPTHTSRAAR